jgi:HEAT repeat protein
MPCVDFFKATIDMLWSLVGVAITVVSSLLQPPSGFAETAAPIPAVVLASLVQAPQIDELVAKLAAANPADRVIAACELQRLGSDARRAIPALVDRLADGSPVEPTVCGKDRYWWSKDIDRQTTPGEEAAAALVAIGTEALTPLVTSTRAPQWIARRNAVWALGSLHDRRAISPALMALADREPPVRRVAAWALGALDAEAAVTALIDALKDQDADVRAQVAWALGAIGDRRAVDGLIGALKDSAEHVRAQAAWALGSLRDPRATDALTALLKDASSRVRRQAAWALGTIGASRR